MKAFVVSVNGKRVCTAGVGAKGVLSACIDWTGGYSERYPDNEPGLNVGGIDGRTDEHVTWAVPALKVGHTVTVEIVEADCADPETERYVPELPEEG